MRFGLMRIALALLFAMAATVVVPVRPHDISYHRVVQRHPLPDQLDHPALISCGRRDVREPWTRATAGSGEGACRAMLRYLRCSAVRNMVRAGVPERAANKLPNG